MLLLIIASLVCTLYLLWLSRGRGTSDTWWYTKVQLLSCKRGWTFNLEQVKSFFAAVRVSDHRAGPHCEFRRQTAGQSWGVDNFLPIHYVQVWLECSNATSQVELVKITRSWKQDTTKLSTNSCLFTTHKFWLEYSNAASQVELVKIIRSWK